MHMEIKQKLRASIISQQSINSEWDDIMHWVWEYQFHLKSYPGEGEGAGASFYCIRLNLPAFKWIKIETVRWG